MCTAHHLTIWVGIRRGIYLGVAYHGPGGARPSTGKAAANIPHLEGSPWSPTGGH